MEVRTLIALVALWLCGWLPVASWATEVPADGPADAPADAPAGVTEQAACDPAVEDCEPPALDLPELLTADATGSEGAVVEFEAGAVDNIDPAPLVACDPSSGSVFLPGESLVTCTATDSAGNLSSGTFTVTVNEPPIVDPDVAPPVLRLPEPLAVDAGSPLGVVVQFEVLAEDNVDPAPVVVCDPSSGSVFTPGTVNVTCTATDAAGNASPPGTFAVTVNAPPVLPPDAPDANDDSVETLAGVAVQIAYLANDVDPALDAAARVEGQPPNGAVEVGAGLFTYTPKAGFVGMERFMYELCRAAPSVVCDSATVTVHVRPAEGMAATALAEPAWQAMSQRPFEEIPDGCGGALAWGGFANGRIPPPAMLQVDVGQLLERQAATQFVAMRAASAQEGIALPLTDSYRTYDAQVALRASKGAIVATATPGRSVHGWAKAIDVNLGASPGVQAWMERNSVRFGWVNPAWARNPGKSYEPWHYEFYGARPASGGSCLPTTTAATAATVLDSPLDSRVTPPAPAPEPVRVAPTGFLTRVRSVRVLGGLAALVAAALTAGFAAKEFRSRRE